MGDWINKNEMLPKRILSQHKDFFLRSEVSIADDLKIIMTVIEEQTNALIKPIIFDIDTVMTKNHTSGWEQIEKSLCLLHKHIREEFDNSLTDKLKSYLNKKMSR